MGVKQERAFNNNDDDDEDFAEDFQTSNSEYHTDQGCEKISKSSKKRKIAGSYNTVIGRSLDESCFVLETLQCTCAKALSGEQCSHVLSTLKRLMNASPTLKQLASKVVIKRRSAYIRLNIVSDKSSPADRKAAQETQEKICPVCHEEFELDEEAATDLSDACESEDESGSDSESDDDKTSQDDNNDEDSDPDSGTDQDDDEENGTDEDEDAESHQDLDENLDEDDAGTSPGLVSSHSEAVENEKISKIIYCRVACGTNFHRSCLIAWGVSNASKGLTCPVCRNAWHEDQSLLSEIANLVAERSVQGKDLTHEYLRDLYEEPPRARKRRQE